MNLQKKNGRDQAGHHLCNELFQFYHSFRWHNRKNNIQIEGCFLPSRYYELLHLLLFLSSCVYALAEVRYELTYRHPSQSQQYPLLYLFLHHFLCLYLQLNPTYKGAWRYIYICNNTQCYRQIIKTHRPWRRRGAAAGWLNTARAKL